MRKKSIKHRHTFFWNDVSPVVRFLITADVAIFGGFGMFTPIFALLVEQKIQTGNILEIIGVGAAIYLFTRSLAQIPVAYIVDKIPGEIDDWSILIAGSFFVALVPIGYMFISEAWHLYLLQFAYGIAGALTIPSWYAIMTRHVDHGKEGLEWGMYQTAVDLSGAVVAPLGAIIASQYGFDAVMIIASSAAMMGMLFTLSIRPHMKA